MEFASSVVVIDPEDPLQDVRRLSEKMDVLGGQDDLTEADQLRAPAFPLEQCDQMLWIKTLLVFPKNQ